MGASVGRRRRIWGPARSGPCCSAGGELSALAGTLPVWSQEQLRSTQEGLPCRGASYHVQ